MKSLLCLISFFLLSFALEASQAQLQTSCTRSIFKLVGSDLKSKIVHPDGTLVKKYLGMKGYAAFAEEYYNSNMSTAFLNVSAVLDPTIFKKLGWQMFQGSVDEFTSLKREILHPDGTLVEDYIGMDGYADFAKEYYNSNMTITFRNVSAVLDPSLFKGLGWQEFQGSVDEYTFLKGKIGILLKKYLGMDGYADFAKKYYKSNMTITFVNVSAVSDSSIFKGLGWQKFQGSVDEFTFLKGKIGILVKKYLGMKGYIAFAKKYYDSDMTITFRNVSAVSVPSTFKGLGWQAFRGTVEEFTSLRNRIVHPDGTLVKKYLGMKGYAAFAKKYYNSNMMITFMNVSAVLDPPTFKGLGWQKFQGSVDEFTSLKDRIVHPDGTLVKKYFGMKGYADFAKEYYNSNMMITFQNTSAVLDVETFRRLGWQQFKGSVDEYTSLRGEIVHADGTLVKKYLGMKGYADFAKKYFNSNMFNTFVNVSAVLDPSTFKGLGWQAFQGSVDEFTSLKGKILHPDGTLVGKYIGMDGCAAFAEKYYNSNMTITFKNVSAVLDPSIFKGLGWQKFQGSVDEFTSLRGKILHPDGTLVTDYVGMDGYADFAEEYYNSNMPAAFTNISAVLGGKKEIDRLNLGWKKFEGSVSQYDELIVLFDSTERTLLQGLEGQKAVADIIFKGHTVNTYRNVSVLRERLLGGEEFSNLEWRMERF